MTPQGRETEHLGGVTLYNFTPWAVKYWRMRSSASWLLNALCGVNTTFGCLRMT